MPKKRAPRQTTTPESEKLVAVEPEVEEVVETVVEAVDDAEAVAPVEDPDALPDDWIGGDSIGFALSGLRYNLGGVIFWTDDPEVVKLADNRYDPRAWPGKSSQGPSRAITAAELAKREGVPTPLTDGQAARLIMAEAAWLKASILEIEKRAVEGV